jgi:anti-sigma B factor antagonist
MELQERKVGDVIVLALSINAHQRGQYEPLQELVRERLAAGDRRFIINLAGCAWIDSAGLGELIKALVAVMRQGGKLKLAAVPGKVNDILTVTNLTQVFEVYEDEAAALANM